MDNVGPAYEMGDLITQDLEKAEVMNVFLPQSFLARPPLMNLKSLRPSRKVGARKMRPWWNRNSK